METPASQSPAVRTCAIAALVCGGCYLGTRVETWLRFPGVGAAVLFPPYAIVTAALLWSPPRTWWAFLLAASIGDFLPHRRLGASASFALMTEIPNHLRALIAASAIRSLSHRRCHFKSLRDVVVVLVFAVFLAPCASAFVGAAIVKGHGAADPFWLVWKEWALSNAITGLTILPILLLGLEVIETGARIRTRRIVEATLLLIGLVATGACVFLLAGHAQGGAHPSRLYWPLPFVLWAAVRFGPGGTSASLLAVTALSIWGALESRGPFTLQSPTESLLELQFFLLAMAVPLLLLSVLLNQQRRTAQALAESRLQYQSVVEDQSEMICRFLPDGTYTFANAAYARAAGRAAAELVGGSIWRIGIPEAHRSADDLATEITPAHPMATREAQVPSPTGETRWQQWRERGFFDPRGAVVEYQAVGSDITDGKRAEDQRRQREAQRSVENALRDADRRKDEFLAMLGHELRNPLAPIGLALQILGQAAPGSSQATWAHGAIARQLAHMTRLVGDLLDISRVTLGKIQLQPETLDLARVIASAVETARPLVDAQKHELTVATSEVPLVVRGDVVRLTQVLANVLNNAAKYTEPGGRIQVSARQDGDSAEISVRDNGIGIAPEALGRIFDLFTQGPAAPERGQGGLGVGLTLAKRLVEMHGGTVEARSAGVNQGSEIIVRLPLGGEGDVDRTPAAQGEVERRQGSLRILAVDDNTDIAHGLAQVLAMWGHTVRTAHDGEGALDAATAFRPDVVLLDLGLPKLDGLEVARRLRRSGENAATLFVSMSGFGQEQTRLRSVEAGFHYHLVKPVDMASLRTLLDDRARNGCPSRA